MGIFHIDPKCDRLMQELADELLSFERQTGRQSVLAFIPVYPDEHIVLLVNGKIRDQQDDNLDTVINWARHNRINIASAK